MYKKLCLLIWLLATATIFSQEYQLKWEKDHFPSVFTDMKFSNDGNYIYAVMSPNLFIISAETGEILDRFETENSIDYDGSSIVKLFVPNQGNLVVTLNGDNTLHYWNTETNTHSHSFYPPLEDGEGRNAIDISDDGRYYLYIAQKSENGTPVRNRVVIFDNEIKEVIKSTTYPYETHFVTKAKFFPNNQKFLLGSQKLPEWEFDKGEDRLTLWNAETMEVEETIDYNEYGKNDIVKGYLHLYTSPDNNKLAYIKSSQYICKIHSATNYSKIFESKNDLRCEGMAFFSNSDEVAITYGYDFDLINIANGNSINIEHFATYFLISQDQQQFYTGTSTRGFLYEKTLDLRQKELNIKVELVKNQISIINSTNHRIDNFQVQNLQGQVVFNTQLIEDNKNISRYLNIPNGVYFIKIRTDNKLIYKKIIVGD